MFRAVRIILFLVVGELVAQFRLQLFMEGVKAKQSHDALHMEVCCLQRNLQHASTLMDLYKQKIFRLEDQVGGTFILRSCINLAAELNIFY
jgi:hypothetical protein